MSLPTSDWLSSATPSAPAADCDYKQALKDAERIIAILAVPVLGTAEIEEWQELQRRIDNSARCFQAQAEALERARDALDEYACPGEPDCTGRKFKAGGCAEPDCGGAAAKALVTIAALTGRK